MSITFLQHATINSLKGFGNILFNGFASDLTEADQSKRVALTAAHFQPINTWTESQLEWCIIDETTQNEYCNDSLKTVRLKCAALFAASPVVQTIGLTLNCLNKIAKVLTFAHLWSPSEEKYNFTARLCEWGKDLLVIISTPLLLIGMLFASLYGATLSPYDGRKLYSTLERLAYSGGYQFFSIGYDRGEKKLQTFLLAPCFQPFPTAHLGGGELGQADTW